MQIGKSSVQILPLFILQKFISAAVFLNFYTHSGLTFHTDIKALTIMPLYKSLLLINWFFLFSESFGQNYPEEFDGALDCASLAVTCAFNRRGTLLAVGCNDGRIVIWDFLTRGIAKVISAHVHPVCSLRLVPQVWQNAFWTLSLRSWMFNILVYRWLSVLQTNKGLPPKMSVHLNVQMYAAHIKYKVYQEANLMPHLF